MPTAERTFTKPELALKIVETAEANKLSLAGWAGQCHGANQKLLKALR